MREPRDKIVGIFFILLSVYVCWKSLPLGLGDSHKPGAGFISFWSGISLGILALLLLIQNICLKKAAVTVEKKEDTHWKAITIILFTLFGCVFFLENLGFIITTTLLVGIPLKTVERKAWLWTILMSLVVALGSYVVFNVWLHTELPEGILGLIL